MKSKINTFFKVCARPLNFRSRAQSGFTLVESVAGLAIFAILVSGILGSYLALVNTTKTSREKVVLSNLATQYLEIVRNLPFSEVGTVNGNPPGSLADASNPIVINIEGKTYHIYYEVTYIDDSADGTILAGSDTAPNDYKQVKMFVQDIATGIVKDFVTTISPQGLEGLSNAGALQLFVYDAVGQPIEGADVHIENTSLDPDIILDRVTDSTGQVVEVALPASVNGYRITATKDGYSTDSTYPITVENPNPTKPDATVVDATVTQLSFFIDVVSDLTVRTVDVACSAINGVGISIRGGKLIGTSPDVYKFDDDFTSSGGAVSLTDIEWDTYTPVLESGSPYTIYGTSPIQQISLLPGTSQEFLFVLGPESSHSLRLIIKDGATGAALEGALLRLQKNSTGIDEFAVTGGSVWEQRSWIGGSGQAIFSDETQYLIDDNNVDTVTQPTGLRLKNNAGVYSLSGELESSTFDMGGANDVTSIVWEPTSQPAGTELKFQLASNNDNLTWDYRGPDGTSGSYYTTSGEAIHSSHSGDQYIRYKAYLSTTNTSATPVLSTLIVNYVSGCATPGQAMFPNLAEGSDYELEVTMTGYASQLIDPLTISGNQALEILMSP